MAILEASELRTFLRYDEEDYFDTSTAELAIDVATGWILAEIRTIPEPKPEKGHPVHSWVVELAGIAYENPTSMTDDQAGETRSVWGNRRLEILAAARAWADSTSGTSGAPLPRGRFPKPRPWPDMWGCR